MNCAAYELTSPAELQRRREEAQRSEATVAKHIARFQQLARRMGVRLPGSAA
ncbi:hypothetical protein H4CHR_01553 [Variovorax sp. PBS-H4]|uniref:hypothetical protein n=1 Tax=Variovorax sp. PBS-H4 TaxID=434008 RepID=UPI0013183514|nr:hypothetical protein [Variovorax sp. PBS-H4]VTU25231.1 hypothetical protein H4CHR_01553 [Variovorax sp. PBS-H4]